MQRATPTPPTPRQPSPRPRHPTPPIQRTSAPTTAHPPAPKPPAPPPPPQGPPPPYDPGPPPPYSAHDPHLGAGGTRGGPSFDPRALTDGQLDELTHRLVGPLTRLLRTELRMDRERIGRLRDPRA
ncbi:hypothetical protein [Streptomyces tendae]|uniref:hypothetical protein n=1 Tax=Streptomyces tendae TaxID=1932 RepID=UPI0019D18861|nr:hypothetical protein [Streptomyces tendae]